MRKRNVKQPRQMKLRRITAVFMAVAMTVTGLTVLPAQNAEAAAEEYEIYPMPHEISYAEGSYIIDEVNVVYEDGIDEATKNRLTESLALKEEAKVNVSSELVDGKTNILVGIDGSSGYVDTYADANITVSTQNLFDELDSYVLDSDNGVITVLGADTDACYYGLTTLYHILKQMDSYTIHNFHIEDWADVASRGFIEGYYGNPWSTEDRCNLMEWGGYYKLNSYFYAPKNDPKHNSNWRELYTQDEINTLIKPLADAGNASKCRFVYALHPFMYNAINFSSDEAYQADLQIVKDKFAQVIEAGVRQIAILADDAANVGSENYIKFLTDMTEWLAEMRQTYPDLKQTLPFCTQEYMYNGESYYSRFPANVQIVMTGGRIWGEVSNDFTTTFTNNAGRGPYMWINWPCTDNSKKHLIMGGYSTFLHPGVDPDKLQGIVLNPMQQSEPSKVAIFGNACYSWNIWESADVADQAWNDSFKYVDHNSAIETDGSNALRELSKHMINQNMDNRVTALQESVELAPLLTDFRDKLNAGTVTSEEADALIAQFEILQDAADTYEEQAGDKNVKDQIIYWLNCWDDTTDAAIAYLNGIKAVIDNDTTSILQYNAEGKTAFDRSKTHALWYLDHYEYAEVGVQHIVPFINALASYLSIKVQEVADPTVITQTYISNAFTNPASGTTDNALDGNDSTSVQFHEPNYPAAGDYFGVRFNRAISVDSLRVLMGGGKNHLQYSKFEYLPEGADEETGWKEVSGTVHERPNGSADAIEETGLNLQNVVAVRLIATQANSFDSWVLISSFDVNKTAPPEELTAYDVSQVTFENAVVTGYNNGSYDNVSAVTDGDASTEFWLKHSSGDLIAENAAVILDLGSERAVGSVYVAQDTARSGGTDFLKNAVVEYSTDKSDWNTFADLEAVNEQTVNGSAMARYIRVRNEAQANIWWRVSEISVYPLAGISDFTMSASAVGTAIGKHNSINDGAQNNKYEYIVDGNDETLAWLTDTDGNGNIQSGAGVEITFDREVAMRDIAILQGTNDKLSTLKVEYKTSDDTWTELKTVENAGASVNIEANGVNATGIRLTNGAGSAVGCWWQLYEVRVTEVSAVDAEDVYTDVENSGITATVTEESAALSAGNITLGAGQYVGIDLKEIRKLTSINAEYTGEGIALQYSDNGKEWYTVEGSVSNETARYIRLVNMSDSEKAVEISSFEAEMYAVGEMGELISSDIPVNPSWGDTRSNGRAFDGDMTTQTKFGGSALAGNTAVYSLGQEININSIRIYTADNTQDYVRDVKVQLSTDGQKWEDAFEIGDGTADTQEQANQTMAQAGVGNVDSNYPNVRYYGNDSLNTSARYMRLLVTANFPSRAMIINEIVINSGVYISTENNMAFSGTLEERGHQPSNMLDGDFTTTYRPSEGNGNMTYKLSESDGVRSFRIIQSGDVSNAVVNAKVYNEAGGTVETVKVGTLAQAVNEFSVKEGSSLLSITVEWTDRIPDIAEIITLAQEAATANKDELNNLINSKPEGYDTWTQSSKDAYDAVVEMAREVADSEYVSQVTVDSAAASLTKAAAMAEAKADAATLEQLNQLVGSMIENGSNIYTTVSYATYETAVNKIKTALENTDNLSQSAAEELVSNAETARNGLVYSTRNRELAELAIGTYDAIVGDNYTTTSYQMLTAAKTAIDDLITQDDAGRIDPQVFIDARTAYQAAMDGLVDVTELKAAINEYESRLADKDLYTSDSWAAYETAVNAGMGLLDAGTQTEIDNAVNAIRNSAPELKPDIALDEVIGAAEAILNAQGSADKYTTDSYDALARIVAEAKGNPNDSYIAQIQSAMSGLVNVEALKAQISAAGAVNQDQYTTSSYKVLTDLLGQTGALLKSGSAEEVASMARAIDNAIRTLEPRATGVQDYVNSIALRPETGYTADSYGAYIAAYNALKNADQSNMSAAQFAQLKADFERAELALRTVSANTPAAGGTTVNTAVNTGDGQSMGPVIVALILCVAVAAAVIIIRKRRK